MENFLKNIVLFGSIIVLMAFGLEYYFTENLKNRNSEGEIIVWNDIYTNNLKDYNHFIYGSSRAWVHIDPFILEKELGRKYYNVGADGQNFTVQKFRHKELKKRSEIKSIIYSVDIFTLNSKDHIFGYEQFLPFMLFENNEIKDILKPYDYYSELDYYLPLTRYYGHRNLMGEILFEKDDSIPSRIRGYKGQERSWNEDFDTTKKEEESLRIEIDKKLLEGFEKFLKECKKNNIELVLIYSPEFIEGQIFVENRDEIIFPYKELSAKYSFPFIDFSTGELNYNKNYFYNALHLNKKGAELFTHQLADSLKLYLK